MNKIKNFIKEVWQVLRLPEMLILPGNLAFFLILSLIPLITLFGVIASSLSLSMDSIVNTLNNVLPKGVVSLFSSFITGGKDASITFIFLGFYIASNGPDSIIRASNVLYGNATKNYIYRRIKAIFMTFWLVIMFVAVLLLMAFGTLILDYLSTIKFIGEFVSKNYAIFTIVKSLVAFLIILFTIKVIYTMAPDIKLKSKYVNRGAFLSTITIMIVTSVYSFYVSNFANYDLIYGSLSNIAILMLLVYMVSYIIVLGIAINHNYYNLDNIDMNKKK